VFIKHDDYEGQMQVPLPARIDHEQFECDLYVDRVQPVPAVLMAQYQQIDKVQDAKDRTTTA